MCALRLTHTPQALNAMDDIFQLVSNQQWTSRQLEKQRYGQCAVRSPFALVPELFSSIWPLEESMLQTWVANFGRQPAGQVATASTLSVTLEKKIAREWDTNCSSFCSFILRRRRNTTQVDHYAVKYHYLRVIQPSAPLVSVEAILRRNARIREKGSSDNMLSDSNVLVRNYLRSCMCNVSLRQHMQ